LTLNNFNLSFILNKGFYEIYKRFIPVLILVFFLNSYQKDFSQQFEKIDIFIDSILKVHNGVGLSIGIVYKDSLIYAKGYGFRIMMKKEK